MYVELDPTLGELSESRSRVLLNNSGLVHTSTAHGHPSAPDLMRPK